MLPTVSHLRQELHPQENYCETVIFCISWDERHMSLTSQSSPRLTYIQHPNGIHELRYHESSRATVDEFYDYIEKFIQQSSPTDLYCILVDARESGHQPLSYYFQRLNQVNNKYPSLQRPAARFAIVYGKSMLIGTVQMFIQMLKPHRAPMRVFTNGRYDEAMAWLEEEQRRYHNNHGALES